MWIGVEIGALAVMHTIDRVEPAIVTRKTKLETVELLENLFKVFALEQSKSLNPGVFDRRETQKQFPNVETPRAPMNFDVKSCLHLKRRPRVMPHVVMHQSLM